MSNKIIRSVCLFTDSPSNESVDKVNSMANILIKKGYIVQTKRICSKNQEQIKELDNQYGNEFTLSIGSIPKESIVNNFNQVFNNKNTHFNLDLTNKNIDLSDVQILFDLIKKKPYKTFNFTYVFNNIPSTPFFPSATYERNGFSIGLQPTDLSLNCSNLEQWFENTKKVWHELLVLFQNESDFLGIDSSIAPLVNDEGSFIGFIKRLGLSFNQTVTTDFYLKITRFIKNENPKPVGLCGLMFPCLEDAELAKEYEKGNFSIERNIFLSLHSGLGVDTYPMGIDEKPEKILSVLKLLQGLSNKYKKPLSCRFVSDGKSKISEKTDFKNQYLYDVVLRPL